MDWLTRRRAAALLAGALVLCVLFVDRPVALYMQRKVYGTPLFDWALRIFPVLLGAGACLALLFVCFGGAALLGRQLRPWMSVVLAAAGAGMAALLLAELLKFGIGRSWVYPTYLSEGIFGVRPLRGGPGYGAFPSATAAVAGAALLVLWEAWPRGRPAYGFVLFAIAVAILVTNSHWASDLLGGALLGGWVGGLVLRWCGRTGTRTGTVSAGPSRPAGIAADQES